MKQTKQIAAGSHEYSACASTGNRTTGAVGCRRPVARHRLVVFLLISKSLFLRASLFALVLSHPLVNRHSTHGAASPADDDYEGEKQQSARADGCKNEWRSLAFKHLLRHVG